MFETLLVDANPVKSTSLKCPLNAKFWTLARVTLAMLIALAAVPPAVDPLLTDIVPVPAMTKDKLGVPVIVRLVAVSTFHVVKLTEAVPARTIEPVPKLIARVLLLFELKKKNVAV